MSFTLPADFCPQPGNDSHYDTSMSEAALLGFLCRIIEHAVAVVFVVLDSVDQERLTRVVLLPLLNGLHEELQCAQDLLHAWHEAARATTTQEGSAR